MHFYNHLPGSCRAAHSVRIGYSCQVPQLHYRKTNFVFKLLL